MKALSEKISGFPAQFLAFICQRVKQYGNSVSLGYMNVDILLTCTLIHSIYSSLHSNQTAHGIIVIISSLKVRRNNQQ
jgi:hypothetical protein